MSPIRDPEYLKGVVEMLRTLVGESEWVEFKENNTDPEMIGEYISALSNSAAILGQQYGYLVWGIRDSDREVVGTTFDPSTAKKGNSELANWLLTKTKPQTHIDFNTFELDGKRVVILEIEAARHCPVSFGGTEYVRVGSYKKNLKDHTEHARKLWRVFENVKFEEGVAASRLTDSEVLGLLDYPTYFDLHRMPLPENRSGILSVLRADGLIRPTESGEWDITNLGAILFAKRIGEFPSLKRKTVRVIQYRGNSRVETIREQVGVRGYAVGFEGIVNFIATIMPSNEVIGQALRTTVPMFPLLAVRELVANALIHQDFNQTGNGPLIELFDGRLEITSPGSPLVDPSRFIDAPPRSRNEALASMMRRIGICEERGSGWDKVCFVTEEHQLPPPLVELPEGSTRVILFGPRPFKDMTKEERLRAVYLHASLCYVNREFMTRASLRKRFGIASQNSATASKLIEDAVEAGLISPQDPSVSRSHMRYIPAWAAAQTTQVI